MFKLERTNTTFLGRWWWSVDRWMLAAIMVLMAFGLVLVMASSRAVAMRIGVSPFHFINWQMTFLGVSVIIMVSISMLSPVNVRRLALVGYIVCLILLVLVQVMGQEIKGSRQWVYILGFSLQPSELMKPCFIVTVGWMLYLKSQDVSFPGYKMAILLYGLFMALVLVQPDFGMFILMTGVWVVQLFIAGLNMLWFVALGAGGIIAIIGAYFLLPHVAKRINSFIDPASGDNYQIEKSLQAFEHGGFWGQGPGGGEVKANIPDSHTDFIFAVAGEELGVILCAVMVCVYIFIVLRGLKRLQEGNNLFTLYAGSGLLFAFGLQAFINMGVALHVIPNTGMTLPFISYGGSSLFGISAMMGMVLAFTRKRYGLNYGKK